MLHGLVESDPKIHGGEPVFAGTRVPVQALLDYRKAGIPVYEFLIDHPTVQPAQAKGFLKWITKEGADGVGARLEKLRRTAKTS
jgi:uncharacterized protein (DUF433 family)